MKTMIGLMIAVLLIGSAGAESYLYLEQHKDINGSFQYRIPKVELNQQKWAGNFFGSKCYYLSEFEGGLVYTAPRADAFNLNHHSLEANWNLGLEVGPVWATYSIGARDYIEGNSDNIPAGVEGFNDLRVGLAWK